MGEQATTILVVDDDPTVRSLLVDVLSHETWSVAVAETGEEALAWISEHGPADLYLVDKNLPGMSGVELVDTIRELDKVCGVLMVTGFPSIESALRSLNLGVDGYVEKPFEVDEIEKQTAMALARQKRRAQVRAVVERARQSSAESPERTGAGPQTERERALGQAGIEYLLATPVEAEQRRIGEMFECRGDEVVIVTTAEACLEQLAVRAFDAVIVDTALGFPKLVEVAHAAQQTPNAPMCIVIGECSDMEVLKQLMVLGVKCVIEREHIDAQLRRYTDSLTISMRLRKLFEPGS